MKNVIKQLVFSVNNQAPSLIHSLSDEKARNIVNVTNWLELSNLLNNSPLQIERIINNPKYVEFKIPKKKGKPRLISQPNHELMKIQRKLNTYLQAVYEFQIPSCVHGFIPKSKSSHRSIVSNARPHVGKKCVLTIDLQNYFTSIRAKQVQNVFLSWQLNQEIATALALLCTYKGSLPTGASTSPVLANLCSLELDRKIMQFTEKFQLTYTRYADDLTFSSDVYIEEEVIQNLLKIIHDCGFVVNHKKIRRIGSHRKQKITGIVVNKKLSVDRKIKKKIRAMEYDIQKNGLAFASERHFQLDKPSNEAIRQQFLNKIQGLKSFVKFVQK